MNEVITNEDRKQIKELMDSFGLKGQARVWAYLKKNPYRSAVEAYIEQCLKEEKAESERVTLEYRDISIAYKIFGKKLIQSEAIDDMNMIAKMPYTYNCALMPDGHRVKENHVPVGGVVITEDCVLPGVVGNDIACSVGLSVTDAPSYGSFWDGYHDAFDYILRNHTFFGIAYNPDDVNQSKGFLDVMERAHNIMDILVHPESKLLLKGLLGTARNHYGTSGDGNHFVEIGHSDGTVAEFFGKKRFVTNNGRRYLAVLSHFGSRGLGSGIADFYLDKANVINPVPKGMEDNAPLYFDTDGWAEDYWLLMDWCGLFAENSHKYVHDRIGYQMGLRGVEIPNSYFIYTKHNFAWATEHGFIHRKGATPADIGQLGVIPATLADESRIVVGLGNPDFLWSASHGAGRKMSRGVALKQGWKNVNEYARDDCGVNLIGAGSDEDPRSYKNIDDVMMFQMDSVKTLGNFKAVHCRMADPRFTWGKK